VNDVRINLVDAVRRWHGRFLLGLLVYYWFILFLHRQQDEVIRLSVHYFLLLVPLWVYLGLNAWHALLPPLPKVTMLPLAFMLLAVGVSVARKDFATAYNAILLGLPILIVLATGATVTLAFLNRLFLWSIPLCVLSYLLGTNDYGFIPGQSAIGAEQNLEWRVGLFPALPESAFFSLLIVLVNHFYNPSPSRFFYYAAGSYFLFLSGVRTSIIALLLVVLFISVARKVGFASHPRFYKVVFACLIAVFILLVNLDLFLASIDIENAFVKQYLFRTEAEVDAQEFAKTAYRGWLWAQHLTIFATAPIAGIGTFELLQVVDRPLIEGHLGTGSESFLTGWLARIGMIFLPMVLLFWVTVEKSIRTGNRFLYAFCVIWAVFSLGYGSFIVPYNFLFLLSATVFNFTNSTATSPQARV
jgi:hypothetical protein